MPAAERLAEAEHRIPPVERYPVIRAANLEPLQPALLARPTHPGTRQRGTEATEPAQQAC
jgi:hypothetical protein